MRIAIASGKGGTGKTTVAVNLAQVFPGQVQLLDCDVEEPNCALFLSPEIETIESVGIPIPQVDELLCTACGECGAFCEFNAIVLLGPTPLVFSELCHGCGGCTNVCPEKAIREVDRPIGVVESGRVGDIGFVHGKLRIGEAMAPPLIAAVKRRSASTGTTIIDSPPGTSCPVIEAVRDCDFVLLVTEPTPFGLEDLVLAVGTVRELGLPFGVVINRSGIGDDRVSDYCRFEDIPILLEIPNDMRVAEAYSRGQTIYESVPELRPAFEELAQTIVGHCSTSTRGSSDAPSLVEQDNVQVGPR